MNDYTDMIRDCHALVWRYRAELHDVWPTPPRDDAIRFAFTEAGEAMDAWLRLKGGYARNNDKTLSVEDELADCAMMLLTAAGPRWNEVWIVRYANPEPNIDEVLEGVAGIFCIRTHIYFALAPIAAYPGIDLPARITARLERIKAKRLPDATDALLANAGAVE